MSCGVDFYGLQSGGSRASLISCYSFPLDAIVQTILQENGMTRSMESIVVRSALYGKKRKSPQHEFILFTLENVQTRNMRPYTVLDRNIFGMGTDIMLGIQSFLSGAASDRFRFSSNKEELLRQCGLAPYSTIETIEFQTNESLPFYQLAIIALATSLHRDRYRLFKANCYWFAGIVWDHLVQNYPNATYKVLEDGRGKFGTLYHYSAEEREQDKVAKKIQSLLLHIESELTSEVMVVQTAFLTKERPSQRQTPRDKRIKRNKRNDSFKSPSSNPNTNKHEAYCYIMIMVYLNNFQRITYRGPFKKLSYQYQERHRQIFPPGFDSIASKSSTQHSPYTFTSDQLYDMLTNNYHPDQHIEHIIVRSASYCKQTTAPKHEFIVLEVEDLKSPGLRNFIALDRNNGDGPARLFFGLGDIFYSFAAKDEFRVSYDGNRDKLLEQCGLHEHDPVESIVFDPGAPLLLYQLAALTRAVSHQRDKYHVITANCYWFAGLIWDCMTRMRPSAYHKELKGNIRGKFLGWLQNNTNIAELEVAYQYVLKELIDTDNRISAQKQKWAYTYDAQLKGDIEGYTKRIQELEALLKVNSSPDWH